MKLEAVSEYYLKKLNKNYLFRKNIISHQEEKSEEQSVVFSLCKCIKQDTGLRINKPGPGQPPPTVGSCDVTTSPQDSKVSPGCVIIHIQYPWAAKSNWQDSRILVARGPSEKKN